MQKKFDSIKYWKKRYAEGGDSGPGSYGQLADFKAQILNDFVKRKNIQTVSEYGCGDGNQLSLAEYPEYYGYDISEKSIEICQQKFFNDSNKKFFLLPCFEQIKSDLTLSLDVIFHLIEDDVYEEYMKNLFENSKKFVGIYSSNFESNKKWPIHVKQRKFTQWIEKNYFDFKLIEIIENKFPFGKGNKVESFSDFYFFEKKDQ